MPKSMAHALALAHSQLWAAASEGRQRSALANKIDEEGWAMMAKGERYKTPSH